MIWDRLKYFSINENWGNPYKMNGALLLLLDTIRDLFRNPFVIHCGYEESGHSPHSQHYVGNAVDFHIETGLPFKTQIQMMHNIVEGLQVADRIGLGFYLDWNHPGFHLDLRGSRARWARVNHKYVGWNEGLKYLS